MTSNVPTTIEEQKRIAKTAQRKPGSEAIAIAGFGGVVLMLANTFLGKFILLPVSSITGVPTAILFFVLSFGVSILYAIWHYNRAKKIVQLAQEEHAKLMHSYRNKAK
ncbi:MAG: hypothetical protein AAF826_07965 [Pseudomonadota bacterium]